MRQLWRRFLCWRTIHHWQADDGGSPCRLTEGFAATCSRCGKREWQPSHCERIGIDLRESPEAYLARISYKPGEDVRAYARRIAKDSP